MNIITNLLFILGSLGVFLFGMKILSQGIQQAAGDKMRKIMATMTHNRLLGIGTGFLTTCILQSSSATTVIVVSFVSAGLLTLIEAIAVIGKRIENKFKLTGLLSIVVPKTQPNS